MCEALMRIPRNWHKQRSIEEVQEAFLRQQTELAEVGQQ